MSKNAPRSKASIETKIKELDESVEWFYGDDFSLDEALRKYQDAQKLAKNIEKDLAELKNQVEVIANFAQSE
jgi:exodeoxyribonuclease VII small subunit